MDSVSGQSEDEFNPEWNAFTAVVCDKNNGKCRRISSEAIIRFLGQRKWERYSDRRTKEHMVILHRINFYWIMVEKMLNSRDINFAV